MTANNCDPSKKKPTRGELEIDLLIAKSVLAECSRVSTAWLEALGVATSEILKLRESEAKAWGLLSRVVFATGFGNPQEEDAALESARVALASRKAGL